MLIPLWVLWTVVVALGAAAVWLPPKPKSLEGEAAREAMMLRLWAPFAVVLVVTLVVTFDRVRVDQDELYEVTDQALALTEGAPGDFSRQKLEVLVSDRLGKQVYLDQLDRTSEEEESGVTRYEVQVGDAEDESYDGSAVCVEVSGGSSYGDLSVPSMSLSSGSCEDE